MKLLKASDLSLAIVHQNSEIMLYRAVIHLHLAGVLIEEDAAGDPIVIGIVRGV